jgi:integrase
MRHQVASPALSNYETIGKNHIRPTFGKKHVSKLKLAEIDALVVAELDRVRHRPPPSSAASVPYSPRRLTQAQRWEMVGRDVASLSCPPRAPRREGRSLSPEQIRELVKVMADQRLVALFLTMLGTGLSRGEALALKWPDVDLKHVVFTVRSQLRREPGIVDPETGVRAGACLFLVEPKTASSKRRVPSSDSVVEVLRTIRFAAAAHGNRPLADLDHPRPRRTGVQLSPPWHIEPVDRRLRPTGRHRPVGYRLRPDVSAGGGNSWLSGARGRARARNPGRGPTASQPVSGCQSGRDHYRVRAERSTAPPRVPPRTGRGLQPPETGDRPARACAWTDHRSGGLESSSRGPRGLPESVEHRHGHPIDPDLSNPEQLAHFDDVAATVGSAGFFDHTDPATWAPDGDLLAHRSTERTTTPSAKRREPPRYPV